MNLRLRLSAVLFVTVLGGVLLSPALPAGATSTTLDQSQETYTDPYGGGGAGGQTFTAGVTGSLTEIQVGLSCKYGTQGMTLELVSGAYTEADRVALRDAPRLATVSIDISTLPDCSTTDPWPDPPSFYSAMISPNVAVTSGQQYTFLVKLVDPYEQFVAPIAADNPYAGGTAYSGPTTDGVITTDLLFRTYVLADSTPPAVDADNDGYDVSTDCDDTNADVHPDATEVQNSIDDNCDGVIDEYFSTTTYTGASNGYVANKKSKITFSAVVASNTASCLANRTVTFLLDKPPTLAGGTPYVVGTAVTNSLGVAAKTVSTTGWTKPDTYQVTAVTSDAGDCVGSSSVAAPLALKIEKAKGRP